MTRTPRAAERVPERVGLTKDFDRDEVLAGKSRGAPRTEL
jgi:hypothetical protein